LSLEVLRPFQRTLPSSSCPFILEINTAFGCVAPELAFCRLRPPFNEGLVSGAGMGW
jgi:hypothetical protein